jgi:hypothetical protein
MDNVQKRYNHIVGSEVPTAVVMISSIFWDITPCSPSKVSRRFGGTCRLHLQGRIISQGRNQRETKWQAFRLCSNTKPIVSNGDPCGLYSGASSHQSIWGRGRIAPGILNFGNRRRWMGNLNTPPLSPGERPHGTQKILARGAPRASLKSGEKRKISWSYWKSNPDSLAIQPMAWSQTDSACVIILRYLF